MKTKIFFVILMAAVLTSCDNIKDLFTTDVETTLELSVPVSVTTSGTGMALKSADGTAAYAFTKTGTLSLDDNDDVADYIDKVKEVNVSAIDASVLGLSAGQTIQTMTVSVNSVGTILTLTNITSSSIITPNISETLLDQIGTQLENDLAITVTVTGTTNVAPMNFTLELAFDALVKAGLF